METLVQLIFIIALAKYSLKAALSGNPWVVVGYAAVAACAALALYPLVIEQPLTIVSEMLGDKNAVGNIALLTTAEAITGIFISVYLIDNYFKPRAERTKRAFALKIMPGILVFGAIAYFELFFFKFRAGSDFMQTAALFAASLFVAITAASFAFRYALKAESLKLEVKVILNMAILVTGLLVSSSAADYNTSHAQAEIQWAALATLVAASACLVALGVWFQKTNIKNILKKRQ